MKSTDYHDYVFKDGKLVGKFEEMYRYSKEAPWLQDKTVFFLYSEIDMTILKHYAFKSICEIGCGLGYFTNRLYRELKLQNGKHPRVTGIDISPTAIQKASKKFPGIRFITGDILKDGLLTGEKFSVVISKEVLWYVFGELKNFLRRAVALIKKGGFLYVSQSFPETDTWVGKEVIGSPGELIAILSSYAKPVFVCVEKDYNFKGRQLVHFLGKIGRL